MHDIVCIVVRRWRDKIREGMKRLGLYFKGDETKDERESRKASSGETE